MIDILLEGIWDQPPPPPRSNISLHSSYSHTDIGETTECASTHPKDYGMKKLWKQKSFESEVILFTSFHQSKAQILSLTSQRRHYRPDFLPALHFRSSFGWGQRKEASRVSNILTIDLWKNIKWVYWTSLDISTELLLLLLENYCSFSFKSSRKFCFSHAYGQFFVNTIISVQVTT